MARRLTLVVGAGSLAPLVADAALRHGDALQIIDVVGRGDVPADVVHHLTFADTPAIIAAIKSFGTTHGAAAGAVQITDADRQSVARAFGLVGRLAGSLGDIGFTGMVLLYCKLNGIKVIGAHDIAPELLAPDGMIAGPGLDAAAKAAARHALVAARAVGGIDLGQSIVMSGDRPVAAEDIEGTDALLRRVGALRAAGLTGNGGTPLILAKALKPKQSRVADLPAIGLQTVQSAAAAGVSIVAVEARRSIVLEREALVAEAAARAISVIGLKVNDG